MQVVAILNLTCHTLHGCLTMKTIPQASDIESAFSATNGCKMTRHILAQHKRLLAPRSTRRICAIMALAVNGMRTMWSRSATSGTPIPEQPAPKLRPRRLRVDLCKPLQHLGQRQPLLLHQPRHHQLQWPGIGLKPKIRLRARPTTTIPRHLKLNGTHLQGLLQRSRQHPRPLQNHFQSGKTRTWSANSCLKPKVIHFINSIRGAKQIVGI